MTGIFITGTGTDVGKTVVSLALCALIEARGKKPAYYKPIQCGYVDIGDLGTGGDEEWIKAMCPFNINSATGIRFDLAVSPHLASEKENRAVCLGRLRNEYIKLDAESDLVMCEGAGGIAVPLDRRGTDMLDLAGFLHLPVILVCLPGLGTLNHSILSYQYLKARGLDAIGFIMCHTVSKKPEMFLDNILTIEQITELPYWGEVAFLEHLSKPKKLSQTEIELLTSGFTDETFRWVEKD